MRVGSAVNQAIRQIGSVIGVALTVVMIGHAGLTGADFSQLYGMQWALALMTGALSWPSTPGQAANRHRCGHAR